MDKKNTSFTKPVKEKATYNISTDIKDDLETCWFKLRRQLKGKKITKSLIVEESIRIILNDLNVKNEASQLYKKLCS